jgi:hypothetical protein
MFSNILLYCRSLFSAFFAFLLLSMPLVPVANPPQAEAQSSEIVMENTTSGGTGWGIYSTRPVISEYVSSSSALIGKQIDSITVNLKKGTSSSTGTAQVGIISPDLSMKKTFASLSIASLTGSYTPTEFKLPAGESYTIGAGDRIGVKYTGGTSSSNYFAIMRDTNTADPYDGLHTRFSYYTTSWDPSTSYFGYDLVMTLKYSGPTMDTIPPSVVASPVGGLYNAAQTVTLTANEEATIYYTLDDTTPTTFSTEYSSAIQIPATTTLRFFGVDSAGNAGLVGSETYTIDSIPPIVNASPAGGTFTSVQTVTLASDEDATVIRYTTEGADPGPSSTIYTSPIQLDTTTTLKFFGTDSAGNIGSTVTENYMIDETPPTVTADPPGGIYNIEQSVTLTSDEPATIHYAADGIAPTTLSDVYSEPILVSETNTLSFFGVDAFGNAGEISTANYVIDTVPPIITATPTGGIYDSVQQITLSSDELGTIIRYTIDGTAPTDASPAYESPIELSSDTVLAFFGKDEAGNEGTLGSETYYITVPDTSPPTVSASPSGGTFGPSDTTVSLTSSEPATIYYTIDDTVPDTNSPVYDSPIEVYATTTVRFFGVDAYGNTGSVVTETYTIDSSGPVISASPSGGLYTSSQSVTLTADESGTSIYYNTDGTDLETTSPMYANPISISSDLTLKFYGIDQLGNVGPVSTEIYDIEIVPSEPADGVAQIYPTKQGGDEWFMNMDDPTSDPRFKPKSTMTKNSDGTWKIKSSSVRANVFTVTGYSQTEITTYNQQELAAKGYMQAPNDWKNVEITGYIKVNSYKKDDNFSWFGRGGLHTNSQECEGTAYKGNLYYSGKARFAKEQWHSGGYSFTTTKTVTDPTKDKWVGFKFIMYNVVVQQDNNQTTTVKLESWIDAANNNNWIKVDEKIDAGGWGDEGDICGGNPDQIITWGGPVVTFRWDSATDVDLMKFSVREIAPPQ